MDIVKVVKYVDVDDGFEFTFEPVEDTINIEEIPDDGYVSKYLTHDNAPTSPDEMGDDDLFIVHYHRDFWLEKPDIVEREDIRDWYQGKHIDAEDDYFIFPVKALIHGMVHIDIGSGGFMEDPMGWDTSHVGACLASRKEFKTEEKGLEACKTLADTWNKYLSGDVWCIVKEKLDENKKVSDYDIVCGYYGREEAEKALEEDI